MLFTVLYFQFDYLMHVLTSDVVLLLLFLVFLIFIIFVLNCLIMIENKRNK